MTDRGEKKMPVVAAQTCCQNANLRFCCDDSNHKEMVCGRLLLSHIVNYLLITTEINDS